MSKNSKLSHELERLENGGYTGKFVVHFSKGVAMVVDYIKTQRQEIYELEHRVFLTDREAYQKGVIKNERERKIEDAEKSKGG